MLSSPGRSIAYSRRCDPFEVPRVVVVHRMLVKNLQRAEYIEFRQVAAEPGIDRRVRRLPFVDGDAFSSTAFRQVKQVFYISPAVLAVSPFTMERQLYWLASHGATSGAIFLLKL